MEINEKIRSLREINQLSQEEMAEKLNMSTNGYAKIERGQRRLDIPKLEQIATVFNMDLIDLLNFDNQKVLCLINDISHSKLDIKNANIYHGTEEFSTEIEKLNLMLTHKNELLAQKDKEIALLNHLIEALKNKE